MCLCVKRKSERDERREKKRTTKEMYLCKIQIGINIISALKDGQLSSKEITVEEAGPASVGDVLEARPVLEGGALLLDEKAVAGGCRGGKGRGKVSVEREKGRRKKERMKKGLRLQI